jgi:cytidine deaminase
MSHTTPPQQSDFKSFPSLEALPLTWRELLEAAGEALQHSYVPYSHFRVGAAVRLDTGTIVSGFNMENASYPVCMCAEQTTLAAARTQHVGHVITAMAITVQARERIIRTPATPCGQCRQLLLEQERINGQPFPLVLRGTEGPIWVFERAADLLPYGFSGDLL